MIPVSNIVERGSRLSNAGASPVDVPTLVVGADVVSVERNAHHVEHMAENGVAHRHGYPTSGVANRRTAHEAVCRLQADATDAPLSDLLRHFGNNRDLLAVEHEIHLDGEIDLGQRMRRKLRVHDGTGDGHDAAFLQPLLGRTGRSGDGRHVAHSSSGPWRSASAPPTISMISVVIAS